MRQIIHWLIPVLCFVLIGNYHLAYAADAQPPPRDFEKEIADATEAIRRNPQDAQAFFNRGAARQDRAEKRNPNLPEHGVGAGDPELDKAMDDFSEAIRRKPAFLAARIRLGTIHRLRNDYEKALAEYGKAIEYNTKSVGENQQELALAYDGRGLVYANRRNYDAAIADYNEAIRLDASSTTPYSHRGESEVGKLEFEKAIFDYSEVIRLSPDSAHGYVERSNVYGLKHDYDHALLDAAKGIRIDPNWAVARNAMGVAYDNYGKAISSVDSKTADEMFDRVSAHFEGPPGKIDDAQPQLPFDGSVEHFRAAARKLDIAHKRQLLFDYAATAFKSAIEIRPDYDFGNNNLGIYYARRNGENDIKRAEDYFHAALKCNPRYADAYNNLGIVLAEQGKFDEAIAAHKAGLALRDNWASDHSNLCRAYLQKGDLDNALKENSVALKCDPNFLDAWMCREDIYLKQNDLAEAAKCARRMVAINAKSPTAVYAQGKFVKKCLELNRPDDAIASLDEFLQVNADVPAIYNARAQAYFQKGDLRRAKQDLEHVSRLLPENAQVKKMIDDIQWQMDLHAINADHKNSSESK